MSSVVHIMEYHLFGLPERTQGRPCGQLRVQICSMEKSEVWSFPLLHKILRIPCCLGKPLMFAILLCTYAGLDVRDRVNPRIFRIFVSINNGFHLSHKLSLRMANHISLWHIVSPWDLSIPMCRDGIVIQWPAIIDIPTGYIFISPSSPTHPTKMAVGRLITSFMCSFVLPSCATLWPDLIIIPPATKLRGGILDSPCSSVRLSVRPSVRPSVGRCPDDNSNSFQWI